MGWEKKRQATNLCHKALGHVGHADIGEILNISWQSWALAVLQEIRRMLGRCLPPE